MDYTKIIISFLLLILGQVGVWFQVYGPLKWPELSEKFLWISLLFSIPLAYIFIQSGKFGKEGFGTAWPVQIITFVAGIFVFLILTKVFFGEVITAKTIISLVLIFIVIIIQFL